MKRLMLALLIFPLLLTSCGGKGSILGTVVGALIIGVLNNGLV